MQTTNRHTDRLYQEMQSLLGPEWTVTPSSEMVGNVRRVVVQNLETGQVLPLDLQVHKGATPFGPVISLGPQIAKTGAPPPGDNPFGDFSGQKYRAVFSPEVKAQYRGDVSQFDPSAVKYRGLTSNQQLVGMIQSAMGGVEKGNYANIAEAFGAMTAGASAYSPITRVPVNMVEAAQNRQYSKVRFSTTGRGGAELPPHIVEAIQKDYEENVVRGTGKLNPSPVEQMTWTQLASGPYFPSKDPGWLMPEANLVRREYSGLPGKQVSTQGYAELSMGLKGVSKGSIEYGGLIAQPYQKVTSSTGAEVWRPQTPGPIREGESHSYAALNMLYPGEKKVRNTELANVLYTPTPWSGGGYIFDDPTANRPDAHGTGSTITEALPTQDLRDILGGKTRFQARDLRGNRFDEGEMNMKLGTLVSEGVEYDFTHRKGVAAFLPGEEAGYMEVPAYWDPKTGKGVASEEHGQSTETILPKLREQLGVDVRRGTTDQIRYVVEGASQTGAKWRGQGGKMGGFFTGQSLFVETYGGAKESVRYMTGEAKGPGVAFSFLASRNIQQLGGIMQQWASNVGTPEAQEMYQYFQKRFGSGDRPVNLEHMTRKYRSITRNLEGDQRFRGSAHKFAADIFESVFLDNVTEEQNEFNERVFGAGYIPIQDINTGAIDPKQLELMRANAMEAGISPEEIDKALREGPVTSGKLKDLIIRPLSRPFLARATSTPLVPEFIGGTPSLNLEAQLALKEQYPSLPEGEATPLQLAKQNILAFTSFGKQALTGKPLIPEGAETLDEEQLLKMKQLLAQKDIGNKEFLEGMKGIVKDPNALLRVPKTGAVTPSINALETLGFEKYGEEIGPILGKSKRMWEKLVKEELTQGPSADPVSAGNRAISPVFKHFNNIIKRRSDFAKTALSVSGGIGATGRYQGIQALPPGTISYNKQMEEMILRGAGVSPELMAKNLKIFEQGPKVLSMRYPQEGMRDFVPQEYMGEKALGELVGTKRAHAMLNDPLAYGTAMMDPTFAQYTTGDWDVDPYASKFLLEQLEGTGNVVPMSKEQVMEVQRLTLEDLKRKELATFPDPTQRASSGAAIGAMKDLFSGLDPVRAAIGKIKNVPLSEVGQRAREVMNSKSFGMGEAYQLLRTSLASAALNPFSSITASTADTPAWYQTALDLGKYGDEAAGLRLPAATAKVNAGIDKQGRAFLGYSTNVKMQGFPEYNRFYPGEADQGSLEDFLSTYVAQATAPIQERGGEKQYIQSAEGMAARFARPEHREQVQRYLERHDPSEYGVKINRYIRKLATKEQTKTLEGMTEYRRSLLDLPAMQQFFSRATSKSYGEGERATDAQFAIAALGDFAGPERREQWEAGAVVHDIMNRMPQGAIAAERIARGVHHIENPVMREAYGKWMQAMKTPNLGIEENVQKQEQVATPVQASSPKAPSVENLNYLYNKGIISRTKFNELTKQREEMISSGAVESTQTTAIQDMSEADKIMRTAAGRIGLTNDPSSLAPSEQRRWQRAAFQGLTPEERTRMEEFAKTDISGAQPPIKPPDEPPTTTATPEPEDDEGWQKPKTWRERRTPEQAREAKRQAALKMNAAQDQQREYLEKKRTEEGGEQPSARGAGYPRPGKYKQQTMVNQGYLAMRALGPDAESLSNSLRADFGIDISDASSFAQSFAGILDDPERLNAVMGKYGPILKQYARGGEAVSKAQAYMNTSGYSAVGDYKDTLFASAHGDPNMVKGLGVFGGALDQKLLGSGKPGEVTINIPTEKINELNKLYEDQKRIVTDLNTAKGRERKELEAEQQDVNTRIRKAQGGIYLEGLQQEAQTYRAMLDSGTAPMGTVKKLMATEKTMQRVQAEQQMQEEEEQVGPMGRTARRLLGGFGLMYLRSVAGFATQGLGYGASERMGYDQTMAQGMYASTGIATTPYNQQQVLQNQMALQGTNINPLLGLKQFGAANPALRDVGSMATAGIGAWAYSQWAASTMPGTATGATLSRMSPIIGMAAASIAEISDIGARTQDENLGMRLGRAIGAGGGAPGINDLAAGGWIALTNPEQNEILQRQQATSYQAKMVLGGYTQQTYQNPRGGTGTRMVAGEQGGSVQDLRDAGLSEQEIYTNLVAELTSQNPNWSQEALNQTAGYMMNKGAGVSITSDTISNIGKDYMFGGFAAQTAQQLVMATGGGVSNAYGQQAGRIQERLAGMEFTSGQRAAITSGLGMMGQMPDMLTTEGIGAYGSNIVGSWQSLNQQLRMAEHLGGLSGTPAESAALAASQAYTRAGFAGLQAERPDYFSFTNQMTPEEAFASQMQSNALVGQADYRMNMAQTFRQNAYNFGNTQLGNQMYNQFLQVPQGKEWQYAQIMNANPMQLQFQAQQNGLALSQMPGLGTIDGQTIGAEYAAMADVNLAGNLTGMKWGTSSFQLGDIGGSQMASRLFGSNWQSNTKFNQGMIQAGISGQSLGGAITLPTGETISEVGGTMGMQLYQQQANYDYQMAQLGLQQKSHDLTKNYQTNTWAIDDQLRALSREQQRWSFDQQGRQLELGRSQFQENYALNLEQSMLQRQWTRQDWGFNAENRNMQWGWKQEDYQENLRFMSGRDRRLAERQMGRETIMHDRESGQIDRQKKRQEELWRLEDERHKLQLEHFEQQQQLQEEALKKSREFYEQRVKLEDEQIRLQREYQQEQMKIQQEQIKLTQEHARQNLEFSQTMAQVQLAMEMTAAAANTLANDGLVNLQQALADSFNPETISAYGTTASGSTGNEGGAGGWIPPQIAAMNVSNAATNAALAAAVDAQSALNPGQNIGLHVGGGGKARGGPISFGGVDLVGEQGEELIINGVVIPNEITQQLKTLGVQPGSSGVEGVRKMDDMLSQYSSQYINQVEGASDNILDKFGSSFVPMKTAQPDSGKAVTVNVYIGNEELKRYVVNAVGEQI